MRETPTAQGRVSEVSRSSISARDDRIDLFRGIALLAIFVDHIEWSGGPLFLSPYTLRSFGLCDAAEVFIFLSGYVSGISYQKTIDNSGFGACQLRAFRRGVQLWLANIVTFFVVADIVFLFYDSNHVSFAGYRVGEFFHPLPKLALGVLLQLCQPAYLDILPIYINLIVFLPLFLRGLALRPRFTWAVVLGLYLLVQFFAWLNYPIYDPQTGCLSGSARAFNHLAWQLLFFTGAALGKRQLEAPIRIPSAIGRLALSVICLVGLIKSNVLPPSCRDFENYFQAVFGQFSEWGFASKATLGPIRIVYFSFLFMSASLLPRKLDPVFAIVFYPIFCLGRCPLPVFCLGVVLGYLSHPVIMHAPNRQLALVEYEVFSSGVMFLLSWTLSHFRRQNSIPHPTTKVSCCERRD